ncbi:amidohydrolase [Spirosoma pollinicola]|uniref:Amidohydrolase n=1 Tax=Spirosoma pollinicola TaxID=2057025 RepID=A0A2K8Z1E1_9BACT|nr:amidohydrolase [Spirosoma pollinicola]AUD03696.1 amidohydrolase [Spirosoma pollinicola]
MPNFYKLLTSYLLTGLLSFSSFAQVGSAPGTNILLTRMDKTADGLTQKVIDWRRDIHQNPELGNREFRTAAKIAAHLQALGIDVQTGVGKTGVVGLLVGGKRGPVVALRADMDALPVTERVDLPFKSTVTTEYNGKKTGVMHACGHDSHVAMLMGAAEVLASVRSELRGTVKFIFQPCEEGPPTGEEGGAKLMVKEGVLDNPKVDVIFGQHIASGNDVGTFTYRPGSVSAENDIFRITIYGKQTHGAAPWSGVDPIVTGAQIIMGLQTIISRNMPLTEHAAVLTIGAFHAGNRENIIPEEATMIGTIRTLDTTMRNTLYKRIKEVVTSVAKSAGATADVSINMEDAMLVNNKELTAKMVPTLQSLAGMTNVLLVPSGMGSEDFAYFAQKVPGFFFSTGARPKDKKPNEIPHHTPDFQIDESSFTNGVKALCHLTVNYMDQKK